MNTILMHWWMFTMGWTLCKRNFQRWTAGNLYITQLTHAPSKSTYSLKFRKEWVGIDYIEYYTVFQCPYTNLYWVEYTDGWGSPASPASDWGEVMELVDEFNHTCW